MPAQNNLNVPPYNDDWDPLKHFHRVMYKPGYPIQARELNQGQAILQDQIEQLAGHFMKDGDMITPGEFSLTNPANYVKVSTITNGSKVEEYIGYHFVGVTSGVKAKVIHAEPKTDTDDATFYVIYEDSGTTSEYKKFLEQETLESDTPQNYTAKVGVNEVAKPITSPAVGVGTLFNVTEGSYYVNGFCVRNTSQIITLDKYGTRPNYRVGFIVREEFVNSSEDPSLLDNAQGYSNFAAPGADRLKITLTLEKLELGAQDPNFITLATIQGGQILGKYDQTIKWNWLYDILAKRTHDESGNYIVTDFAIKPLEYHNSDGVDGVWDADPETGEYPPVPRSSVTENLTFDQANALLSIRVDQGLAYVMGYEVGYSHPFYVYGNKARNLNFIENNYLQITEGHNVTVTNVFGNPNLQNIRSAIETQAFAPITVYRNFLDGHTGDSVNDLGIPLIYGQEPSTTVSFICDGTPSPDQVSNGVVVFSNNNSIVVTQASEEVQIANTIGGVNVLSKVISKPRPSGVVHPRYFYPKIQTFGMNDDNNEFYGTNSAFKLGFVNSTYFTELLTVSSEGDNKIENRGIEWKVGQQVFGETSQTFATVEEGSDENILIVSNVIGQFINGEYISQVAKDQSNQNKKKRARLAFENEIIEFQFLQKQNQAPDKIIAKSLGQTIVLKKDRGHYVKRDDKIVPTKKGLKRLNNFPFNATVTGVPRVDVGIFDDADTQIGYVVYAPGKITNTIQKGKSFFSKFSDTALDAFSADISVNNNVDAEVFDIADKSLFTGKQGQHWITCDNFNGDPSNELVAGDIVTLVDDEGIDVNAVVMFVTAPTGYGDKRAKSKIYFTTTFDNNVTGKTVQRIRLNIKGREDEHLLFKLPATTVSTLQSNPERTRINYQVVRQFVSTVEDSGGGNVKSIILTTSRENEVFATDPSKVVISYIEQTDNNDSAGRQIVVKQVRITGENNNRDAEFIFDTSDDPNSQAGLKQSGILKILAPVNVSDAHPRLKIRRDTTNNPLTIDLPNKQLTGLLSADVKNPINFVYPLGLVDVYRINAVTINAKPGEPGAVDITQNFILDDGQRDSYYDVSRLVLKEGMPVPTKEMFVDCNYFEHGEEGDFFCVDSYTHDKGVFYDEIPVYTPGRTVPTAINEKSLNRIELRDCVDFRPKVATDSKIATITKATAENAINFKDVNYDSDAFAPRIPVSGSTFQFDMSYYLPRVDSLFLEKTGKLILTEGNAAAKPNPPADMTNAIRLYDLHLPAYTFSVNDIEIKKFNYRRYTMADIAVLDRKIENLTELVTLSLLEQSALNMNVRDAVTGLDRFKNGIVVDSFRNHGNGDTGNRTYRCSIDNKLGQLRPPFFNGQVELEERNFTDNQRKADNYVVNNGIATCEFTSIDFLENPHATTSVNLQPYSVFTYKGDLALNPSIDTFSDVNTLPKLVIEDNSVYDAMVNMVDGLNESGIGTVWGDWETVSTNTTSQQRTSEEGRATVTVTETTTSVTESRNQTTTTFNVSTGAVVETSYGSRVTDVQLAKTMRSIPIRVTATRMKPNTRYYVFFDNINCSSWFNADKKSKDYPDKLERYPASSGEMTSIRPSDQEGFGGEITTDAVGNLFGIFLVPNGRPPVEGSKFTTLNRVEYQGSGDTRSFNTGSRIMRLSTSETNSLDEQELEGYAETSFTASGVIQDKQETIVSTRLPEVTSSSRITDTQTQTTTSTGISDVDVEVRGPDVIETVVEKETIVERETIVEVQVPPEPEEDDPVAQTFLIDKTNPDGVFITELEAYFKTKDDTQSVMAYLVSTDGGVPTKKILPHSKVVLQPDTRLRIRCELPSGTDSIAVKSGFTIIGETSGATGVVKSTVVFESARTNANKNVTNNVYNLLLDNHLGEFVPGEIITVQDLKGVQKQTVFVICEDEVKIYRVDLKNLGTKYDENTTVEFSTPELPGGVTATGHVRVAPIIKAPRTEYVTEDGFYTNGQVFEIVLDDPGSGYVRVPEVTINGEGGNAEAICRTKKGKPGVKMGVATSEDGSAPTLFRFKAPVYCVGETEYAFVLHSPNSIEYRAFTSRLGDDIIGTKTRVTQQPSLGALFKSQNGGLWTEDQTQDIKFKLRRASFRVNTSSTIVLNNAPMDDFKLRRDPISTNATAGSNKTRGVFGSDPTMVQVKFPFHGLKPGDLVAIDGVVPIGSGNDLGGIPIEELNTLHRVQYCDLEKFYIKTSTGSTETINGGGDKVFSSRSYPYEVINVTTGAMAFGDSLIGVTNRSTQSMGTSVITTDFNNTEARYNGDRHFTLDVETPINMLQSLYYNQPMVVGNNLNECNYNDALHLGGEKSLKTIIRMSTLSPRVTPVIDLERTNANVITNLVDNPNRLSKQYGPTSNVVSFNSPVDVVAGQSLVLDDTEVFVKAVDFDKKSLLLHSEPGRTFSEESIFGDETLNLNGIVSITNRNAELYNDETDNVGSVYSKWLSKLFIFENTCDGVEVKISAIFYNVSDIRLYYKPRTVGFDGDVTTLPWIPFNPTGTLPNEVRRVKEDNTVVEPGDTDYDTTLPLLQTPGLPNNVELIKPRSNDSVDPNLIKGSEWQSLTFSAQDIAKFDAISVKIVMSSSNPATAPIIDDMQLVASE